MCVCVRVGGDWVTVLIWRQRLASSNLSTRLLLKLRIGPALERAFKLFHPPRRFEVASSDVSAERRGRLEGTAVDGVAAEGETSCFASPSASISPALCVLVLFGVMVEASSLRVNDGDFCCGAGLVGSPY